MSGDFPENLQIKREPSPPSAPEDKSPNNIKAKLHLHVKRRLQDFNQTAEENTTFYSGSKIQVTVNNIKQEPQKEVIRQKRPYQKRTDKSKASAQSFDNSSQGTVTLGEATTLQRKYKHKIKQIVANDKQDLLASSNSATAEENVGEHHNAIIAAGTISAGDEDEGGQDELKAGREKDKCPDVLAMVLSMKKRALMQDPEVQGFLKEIMQLIKS